LINNPQVGAILWAGYPGQSGGEAIAQILLGEYSPSGRLVSTMYPVSYIYEVPMSDQSMRPSSTNPGRTYKWYTSPLYNFGDGLSYTTFAYSIEPSSPSSSYSIASLAESALAATSSPAAIAYWLWINNTGSVTSDCVALGFLSANVSYNDIVPPIKQLFDFTHQYQLPPGSSTKVWFQLSYKSLLTTDHQGHRWMLPGEYTITINNEKQTQNTHTFRLEGEPTLIHRFPNQQPPITPTASIPQQEQVPSLLLRPQSE